MPYIGIDYGSIAGSNRNTETGIHYGVINQNSINLDFTDDFEYDYGKPTCPECGNPVIDFTSPAVPEDTEGWKTHGKDYACLECESFLHSGDCFSDEALGFSYDSDGYRLADCLDSCIFVFDSPYYTFTRFCSPCVPGAGDLDNPITDGVKTYCLGHDWFDNEIAPYPVFSVKTNERIEA